MTNESEKDKVDILDLLNDGIRTLEAQKVREEEAFAVLDELDDYLQGKSPADIHETAPLKLEDAICLPELQGYFAIEPTLRTPSESMSIKTLRKAIADGHLAVLRPNTKNLYVTRKAIKEWLESCQDPAKLRISSSGRNDVMPQGGSHTKPSISSTTTTNSTALDAALTTLAALKGSSKHT
ncbi:hypothetical protein [Ochrobactrum chromiisoli]|uniref:Helix-turn-helix domain-containing protein n=1 Tax=Ochrobactrum chromiisoli TaxID=2993941 RepID=A0ABT3QKW9_9HYPH|nr:hypothetical protein [Ochrobactrum chromiisoli]MCX2696220.1 hypothetical protein [Ochrobactrum chromiisoli]